MGWRGIGNPQPKCQGNEDAQAARIARDTANRKTSDVRHVVNRDGRGTSRVSPSGESR